KYLYKREDIENYDVDIQALAEIRFTLGNSQMRLIMHCETARDAWEKLKAKHLHSIKSNRIFLKNQFPVMKMKEKETMQQFISRIDEMAEQLTSLSDDQVSDEDKALVLTRGVPESYTPVILAIQESGQFGDYEHVTTSLLNEETRRNEKNKK